MLSSSSLAPRISPKRPLSADASLQSSDAPKVAASSPNAAPSFPISNPTIASAMVGGCLRLACLRVETSLEGPIFACEDSGVLQGVRLAARKCTISGQLFGRLRRPGPRTTYRLGQRIAVVTTAACRQPLNVSSFGSGKTRVEGCPPVSTQN